MSITKAPHARVIVALLVVLLLVGAVTVTTAVVFERRIVTAIEAAVVPANAPTPDEDCYVVQHLDRETGQMRMQNVCAGDKDWMSSKTATQLGKCMLRRHHDG